MLLLTLLGSLAASGPAHAVDVSALSDFESDPCFLGVSARNSAQHVGAPDSAIADACDRAHGSVEVAWDFILRMWRPPDVAGEYTPRPNVRPLSAVLGLVGIVLSYAILGWPVRAAVAVLDPVAADWPARNSHWATAGLAVFGRLLIGTLLLTALSLPFGRIVCATALAWAVTAVLRGSPPFARDQRDQPPASATAIVLANTINDIAAALPALLGVALLAQGDWSLLAVGVLLSVPFSIPTVARAWWVFRQLRPGLLLGGVVLAVFGGVLAAADPATAVVPAAGITLPVLLGLAVAWRGTAVSALRLSLDRRQPRESPPKIPGV